MNTQDRAVVKALLQYMTTKCLTGSDEFRAALKHFNVTTTWQDKLSSFSGDEHFVDVFSPHNVDTKPGGFRTTFPNEEVATAYAKYARAIGDEPVNARVLAARDYIAIEAAHAEALAINDARSIIMRAIHVAANSFGGVIGEAEELVGDLTKIGRADLGLKVESLMDAVECDINKEHDAQRANFRRCLHAIANAL